MSQIAVPKHLKIEPEWAGLTVFDAVRRAFPEVSPREVFRKARHGEVRRDDRPCHPLDRVAAGDVVTVVLPRPAQDEPRPVLRAGEPVETERGPFWIVHEDADLLAVSKPPGCASHPAHKHGGDTLIERVRAYLGVRPEDPFQPALANRLDIETSGIVLVAKNRNARRRLGRNLQRGNLEKRYLALVGGWPTPVDGEIRAPLVRRPDSRDRARHPPGHPRLRDRIQDALTRYQTLEQLEHPFRAALLEVDLVTGRTHQIRRHLGAAGHPLAGDRRYGDPALNHELRSVCGLERLFLHALRVRMAHPGTGESLDLRAPLPEDLRSCLRSLGSRLDRDLAGR